VPAMSSASRAAWSLAPHKGSVMVGEITIVND
jgi:hypothetical protein